MSKEKKDIQGEIYHFIEDTCLESNQKGVVLQVILDKFSDKYKCSETTITRYLDELVHKRSPFHLRTWYDKNRYYGIWTVSRSTMIAMGLSIALPVIVLIVDVTFLHYSIIDKTIFSVIGFWIGFFFHHFTKNAN